MARIGSEGSFADGPRNGVRSMIGDVAAAVVNENDGGDNNNDDDNNNASRPLDGMAAVLLRGTIEAWQERYY